MFARVYSGGLIGMDAYRIELEVDMCGGIGQIQVVGLPDAAVKESQERVRSAIKSCAFFMPSAKKWVVNLAPADTRKEGPAYDLPMAVSILASSSLIPSDNLSKLWIVGELSLDGSVRPITGILPIALVCKKSGAEGIIVPDENGEEAALVEGLRVYPVSHLKQVCCIVTDPKSGSSLDLKPLDLFKTSQRNFDCGNMDFKDVKGQSNAKRALEIAAAGHHNILMVGPPGSGKSMLAQRLPFIMPPLSFEEALELTQLYSAAGLLAKRKSFILERPFRSPHHTASSAGLIGGGSIPRPGEISLSHKGILFLDELTEFPRNLLETLRQPLECQQVTITRAQQALTYPASFLLVGACNPCPCGYKGDDLKACTCTPGQADRYWSKLSGPFMDRIDLQVDVRRLCYEDLVREADSEPSENIYLRVMRSVDRQRSRLEGEDFVFNGQLKGKQLSRVCKIDERGRKVLANAVSRMGLSARAYDRILRVSRTIADLSDSDTVDPPHIAEAVRYRSLTIAA